MIRMVLSTYFLRKNAATFGGEIVSYKKVQKLQRKGIDIYKNCGTLLYLRYT